MNIRVGDKIRIKSYEAHLQIPNVILYDNGGIRYNREDGKELRLIEFDEILKLDKIKTVRKIEQSDYDVPIYTLEDENFFQVFGMSIEEIIKE